MGNPYSQLAHAFALMADGISGGTNRAASQLVEETRGQIYQEKLDELEKKQKKEKKDSLLSTIGSTVGGAAGLATGNPALGAAGAALGGQLGGGSDNVEMDLLSNAARGASAGASGGFGSMLQGGLEGMAGATIPGMNKTAADADSAPPTPVAQPVANTGTNNTFGELLANGGAGWRDSTFAQMVGMSSGPEQPLDPNGMMRNSAPAPAKQPAPAPVQPQQQQQPVGPSQLQQLIPKPDGSAGTTPPASGPESIRARSRMATRPTQRVGSRVIRSGGGFFSQYSQR